MADEHLVAVLFLFGCGTVDVLAEGRFDTCSVHEELLKNWQIIVTEARLVNLEFAKFIVDYSILSRTFLNFEQFLIRLCLKWLICKEIDEIKSTVNLGIY